MSGWEREAALARAARRYTYSFSVWPEEAFGFSPAVFDLFRMFETRMMMEFTEAEFAAFRADLLRHGLTLREVERWPHHEPEAVP
jgi:hypothetical protein